MPTTSLIPPPETYRAEPTAVRVQARARPVISSPRVRRYRAGASLWFSIAVHAALLFLCVLLLRFGPSAGVPTPRPQAGETVQYFELSWPTQGAAASAGVAAPAASEQGAAPGTGAAAQQRTREPAAPAPELNFPRTVPSGISPAPAAEGGAPAAAGETATGAAASGPSGASGVLRPGFSDSRLYVDPGAITGPDPKQSKIERYRQHLRDRIDAVNDSVYEATPHPNTDWTKRDGNGNRWGIAPDGIHLGKVTIPRYLIPIPSTGSLQKQEEERTEEEQREEIQRQTETGDIRETQKERIKAIRERKAAEHGGDSGGAAADSASSGS